MIDVVPVGAGQWLARCECDATAQFPDPESGWAWVLGHPCGEAPATIDVTEPTHCGAD